MKYAVLGLAGSAALCLVLVLTLHRSAYRRTAAKADSPDVRQALELLRGIAAHPATAAAHMAPEAGERAREGVAAAAQTMGKASSVDFKGAAWFGVYLRVAVTCPRDNGPPYERCFFMRKEGGELRITGVES